MLSYYKHQVCAVSPHLHGGSLGLAVDVGQFSPRLQLRVGSVRCQEWYIRAHLTSNVTGRHCKARKFPLVSRLTQPSLEKHLTEHLNTDERGFRGGPSLPPFPQACPVGVKGTHPLLSRGQKFGGHFLSKMSPSQISSQFPASLGSFPPVSYWCAVPPATSRCISQAVEVIDPLASAFQAHLRGTTVPSKALPVVSYCLIILPI